MTLAHSTLPFVHKLFKTVIVKRRRMCESATLEGDSGHSKLIVSVGSRCQAV